MGGFRIYQDNYADFTVVSNQFIDEYMEDANDAQLKIYLYLMRMLNADLATDVSGIADRFNYTEKDVMRALRYWEKKNLLVLEYNNERELIGVRMLPVSASGNTVNSVASNTSSSTESSVIKAEPAQTNVVVHPALKQVPASVAAEPQSELQLEVVAPKPQYTQEDLLRFKSADGSSQLVFIAETYLQKTLSVAELSSLFYISDVLRFSDDLIDYLLQYCVGLGKTSYRYIEAVARDWAQSGITTSKQAAAHARKYDRIVYEVMNALGKSSAPTTTEIAYITKWTQDFAYDMSVISVACERTVLNTDKRRFNYADSILSKWHELGIRHKADIDSLDSQPKKRPVAPTGDKNRFNQFSQRTYDYAALESALISN